VVGLDGLDLFHDVVEAPEDLSEHDVLAVEVLARGEGDEELGAVRVRTAVGHREQAGRGEGDREPVGFVCERGRGGGRVDGFAPGAVVLGDIYHDLSSVPGAVWDGERRTSALDHKLWNHTMKDGVLVVKGMAGDGGLTAFAGAKGSKAG